MVRLLCCDISALGREEYALLYALAGPDRRNRADSCRRMEDGLRCLASEALLRYALPGADLTRLTRGPWGKPQLPGAEFNLSHAGAWVVLAVGDSPLGVDVEQSRPGRDLEGLARRHFSPREQAYVLDSREGREERFLHIWTAKESYLKYLGTGLSRSLDSFCTLSSQLPPLSRWPLPGGCWVTLCTREAPPSGPETVAPEALWRDLV